MLSLPGDSACHWFRLVFITGRHPKASPAVAEGRQVTQSPSTPGSTVIMPQSLLIVFLGTQTPRHGIMARAATQASEQRSRHQRHRVNVRLIRLRWRLAGADGALSPPPIAGGGTQQNRTGLRRVPSRGRRRWHFGIYHRYVHCCIRAAQWQHRDPVASFFTRTRRASHHPAIVADQVSLHEDGLSSGGDQAL